MKSSQLNAGNNFDEYFKQKLASVEVDASLAEAGWQSVQLPAKKTNSSKLPTGFWFICIALLVLIAGSIYLVQHNKELAVKATVEKKISKDIQQHRQVDSASIASMKAPEQNDKAVKTSTVTFPVVYQNAKPSRPQKNTSSIVVDTAQYSASVGLQPLPVIVQQAEANRSTLLVNNKVNSSVDSSLSAIHLPAEKKKDSTVKKAPSIIW